MLRKVGSYLLGISQFPFAAEAVFAFGPYEIHIDRRTLEVVDTQHQHRPVIRKSNGADVPAYTFLDPRFNPISAIWAADMDETWIIGNAKPMAVIHNPNCSNPISTEYLPAHSEYVANETDSEFYTLTKRPGRLKE